jgi:hypothetical protein
MKSILIYTQPNLYNLGINYILATQMTRSAGFYTWFNLCNLTKCKLISLPCWSGFLYVLPRHILHIGPFDHKKLPWKNQIVKAVSENLLQILQFSKSSFKRIKVKLEMYNSDVFCCSIRYSFCSSSVITKHRFAIHHSSYNFNVYSIGCLASIERNTYR